MKSVGKQLQEARLARNWTPELAARETKIKVDRVRDLESDNYSNFTSPTYARGFVRTYARCLGLDEYKILRQLDNKLPDDDNANIVTDTGIAYLPETSLPPRVAHRDFTGLYVVMALGCVVVAVSVFVIFEAYRVGELSRYFGTKSTPVASDGTTNAAPATASSEPAARALPIDSNTPPPINDSPTNVAGDSAPIASVRALPVDPASLNADTSAAPNSDAPVHAVRALPVDPSELGAVAPATVAALSPAQTTSPAPAPAPSTTPTTSDPEPAAPRALPVSAADLAADAAATPSPVAPAPVNPPPQSSAPAPSSTARQADSGPVILPAAPAPVDPPPPTPKSPADAEKQLVLTASQDSFVRVTSLDAPDSDKPLYAAVLHSGQSVGFDGHKFSINVGNPSAVDIRLDGVNYGPHSDQGAPETFTVESHIQ